MNADLDMGYMRNERLKDHGQILDPSNSGVLVQHIEMEKVLDRQIGLGRFVVEKQQCGGEIWAES